MNYYKTFLPAWYARWFVTGFLLFLSGASLLAYCIFRHIPPEGHEVLTYAIVGLLSAGLLIMYFVYYTGHFMAIRQVKKAIGKRSDELWGLQLVYWIRAMVNGAFLAVVAFLVISKADGERILPIAGASMLLLVATMRTAWQSTVNHANKLLAAR